MCCGFLRWRLSRCLDSGTNDWDPAAEKGEHAGIDRGREDHVGDGEEEGGAEEQDLAPRRTNLVGDESQARDFGDAQLKTGFSLATRERG